MYFHVFDIISVVTFVYLELRVRKMENERETYQVYGRNDLNIFPCPSWARNYTVEKFGQLSRVSIMSDRSFTSCTVESNEFRNL